MRQGMLFMKVPEVAVVDTVAFSPHCFFLPFIESDTMLSETLLPW